MVHLDVNFTDPPFQWWNDRTNSMRLKNGCLI